MPSGVYHHKHSNLPSPGPGRPIGSNLTANLNLDLAADIRHFFGTIANAWRNLRPELERMSLSLFYRIVSGGDCFDTDAAEVEKAWAQWSLRLKAERDLTETLWRLPKTEQEEPLPVPHRIVADKFRDRLRWFGTDRERYAKLGLEGLLTYKRFVAAMRGEVVTAAVADLVEARVRLWETTFLLFPDSPL